MTSTPLIKLDNIFLKREDLNLTGSAKDRAISLQIQKLKESGYDSAVISSTGNAAISALFYCRLNKINLHVFVSPKIDNKKLALIKKKTNNIYFSPKPISDAFKFSKSNNYYYLRQSQDPVALIGYQQIGKELLKQIPEISSIFIPVGSGTTLLGISQSLPKTVKIFAVQPASHCPISGLFDKNFITEDQTITDALSVKSLPLKSQILSAIKTSSGSGIVVQNEDVIASSAYLKQNKINTSPEGALALSGYLKAKKNNFDLGEHPVILLTGIQR